MQTVKPTQEGAFQIHLICPLQPMLYLIYVCYCISYVQQKFTYNAKVQFLLHKGKIMSHKLYMFITHDNAMIAYDITHFKTLVFKHSRIKESDTTH